MCWALALSLSGLGHATVHFASAATYSTGKTPVAAAVGDFNGDGRVDLAVAIMAIPISQTMPAGRILLATAIARFNQPSTSQLEKLPLPSLSPI
jgi:hypothetical protein